MKAGERAKQGQSTQRAPSSNPTARTPGDLSPPESAKQSAVEVEEREDKEEEPEEDPVDNFVFNATKKGVAGYRKEFSALKGYKSKKFKHDAFSANMARNRYESIVCLDRSRTVLKLNVPPDTDYIHASWINLPNVETRFIAAQIPLATTIGDFWRLCFQETITTVIILCNTSERGENIQFWPTKRRSEECYGHITVRLKKFENEAAFEVYALELFAKDCFLTTVSLKLFRMTSWPSTGVPQNAIAVLQLLQRIGKGKPCAVLCSDGVGRSCTLIAIEAIKQRLFAGSNVIVKELVQEMRELRASCITSEGQYLFIIGAILEYIKVRFHGQNQYRKPALQFQEDVQKAGIK